MIRRRRRRHWSRREPDSSPSWPRRFGGDVGSRVGLARQKVNYIWRAGVARVGAARRETKWGGLTNACSSRRPLPTSCRRAPWPGRVDRSEVDRLSASYLIALGRAIVREVADLVRRAQRRANAWRPSGGYRGALPVAGGSGGVTAELARPSRNSFRSTTTHLRPAAARIAWWSWLTSTEEIRFQGATTMSVKKEANGRRSVQVEFEVPAHRRKSGTPSPRAGISSWFVPCEFEEQDGSPLR